MTERRDLVVTVDGEARDATWKQGIGIWVPGHDINKGDRIEIEGTPYRVRKMIRVMKQQETWTVIEGAEEIDEGGG